MNLLDRYIRDCSSLHNGALDWIERQSHLRTNHARMLCGPSIGALLSTFVRMSGAERILEIGVFTGYSSVCLASALDEGGHLDAIEINDEMQDLILEGYERAGVSDRITLHIGDAKDVIPALDVVYDLVYIDANKREYALYLELVLPKLRSGSWIVADNVLWDGKVYGENGAHDAQTLGIKVFNEMVRNDERLENFLLPLRDGLNVIRVL